MTLHLSAQSLVVVCPDCGQRYDPAKAAKIARVRTRDGRTIKPGRVEAQNVREPGHFRGRHHQALRETTHWVRHGWCPVPSEFARPILAEDAARPTVTVSYLTAAGMYFFCVEQAEFLAVEIDDAQMRAEVERCVRAARAVREDHPWWRAYLHELGMGADEIARGVAVNDRNKGDVFFGHLPHQVVAPAPTLRGLL